MSASKAFKPYRAADYLQTPEEAAEYLNAAIEDGHPIRRYCSRRFVTSQIRPAG